MKIALIISFLLAHFLAATVFAQDKPNSGYIPVDNFS
jgi:hypothetical protein